MDERIERARQLYERAVFAGDAAALPIADRELDAVEADLALARGRIVHARFLAGRSAERSQAQRDEGRDEGREEDREEGREEDREEDPGELALFERAARLYELLGDVRGQGESLFWVGTFHQVVRRDNAAAVPALERSAALAAQVGDALTLSYALRHLGIAEHAAGRLDAAQERLEESVRLRREIGFLPGVAANLLGLAYIAAATGRRDEALALIEEAASTAEASGAAGIMSSIEQARAAL